MPKSRRRLAATLGNNRKLFVASQSGIWAQRAALKMWLDNGCVTHPSNGAVTQAPHSSLSSSFEEDPPLLLLGLFWARMEGDPPGRFSDFGGCLIWCAGDQRVKSNLSLVETLWCSQQLKQLDSGLAETCAAFYVRGKISPWNPYRWKSKCISFLLSYNNKLPQIQWLKQCVFLVLQFWKSEGQNGFPKSRCQQGCSPSGVIAHMDPKSIM